jgi:hypothetical protein
VKGVGHTLADNVIPYVKIEKVSDKENKDKKY